MTASPAISLWLSKYHTLGSFNVWKCSRSKKSPLCKCFLAKLFQTTMKCRNSVHSNLRNRSNFMTPFAFSVSFPCHELFNKWQVLNRPLRRAHEHNRITCLATLSLKASYVSFASLFSTGLMADQTGNYISSFKMTGGVLMLAFVIPFALIFINRRKSSSQSNSAGQEKFETRKQQTLLLEQMWQSMTFLITKNISYHYLRFKDFFLVSTLPTFFSLLTRVFRVTVTRLRSLFGSVYSNLMHAVRP